MTWIFKLLPVVLPAIAVNVLAATNPFQVVQISSPDGSARAKFIPYGATATEFWVKDKFGTFRDVLLGFDNLTLYQSDAKGHPYFGSVVGRYANRIRKGQFTIPISKNATGANKFQIIQNEGENTLHGGTNGFDRRVWSIVKKSTSSVTFKLVDPDGEQGFPGTVLSSATYTLGPKATWHIAYDAVATEKTPIMLSGHHYWNLEAYKETQDLVGHHAQIAASRFVATDGALIPTGVLTKVERTPLDFRKAKSIGGSINATAEGQYCGTGCVGFDNAWIYDAGAKSTFSTWSVNSGIKLDVKTNQPALQIYSCNGIAGTSIPRKASQGGPASIYENHSCIVIEQESYIDAINNPEFGINQIYSPTRPYHWTATYTFSVLK